MAPASSFVKTLSLAHLKHKKLLKLMKGGIVQCMSRTLRIHTAESSDLASTRLIIHIKTKLIPWKMLSIGTNSDFATSLPFKIHHLMQ